MPCCNSTTFALFVAVLTCLVLGQRSPTEASTAQPPVVTEGPSSIYYKERQTVSLTCVASGVPTPSYGWLRNDTPVVINGSATFDQSDSGVSSTLIVNTADPDAQGAYRCVAKNSHGVALSGLASLRRAYLKTNPSLVVKYYDLLEGFRHILGCGTADAVESVPVQESRWSVAECEEQRECRKWKRLTLKNRHIIGPDGSLGFSYVLPKDAMMYRCDAYNRVLRKSQTVAFHKLNVAEAADDQPKKFEAAIMFEPVSPVVGAVGEKVTLQCYFSGRPPPEMEWTKNGEPDSILGQDRTLNIANLQTINDGTYKCQVKDQKVWQTVAVRVSPVIEVGPQNVFVYSGDDAEFQCHPEGSGLLAISWYYNGISLSEKSNISLDVNVSVSSDSRTLTLHRLQVDQTGSIMCSVSSTYGSVVASGFVLVQERPAPVAEPTTTTSTSTTSTSTPTTTSTTTATTTTTRSTSTTIAKPTTTAKSPTVDPTPLARAGGAEEYESHESTQSVENSQSTTPADAYVIKMSSGGIIGVIIACAVMCLLLLLILICLATRWHRSLKKRRKKQKECKQEKGPDVIEGDPQAIALRVDIVGGNRDSYQGDDDCHSDDSGLGGDDRHQERAAINV